MSYLKGIFSSIRIVSAFVLNGIVSLTFFYLSGALNLVGSESQIIYLVPGFLAGGLLFSISGTLISKVRWSTIISLVAGAILIEIKMSYSNRAERIFSKNRSCIMESPGPASTTNLPVFTGATSSCKILSIPQS